MLAGRVAPPSVVVRQRRVRRAEVGGGDGDGARQTRFGVAGAGQIVARAARQAVVEKSSTQCSCFCTISLAVQITIPTSTSCINTQVSKS